LGWLVYYIGSVFPTLFLYPYLMFLPYGYYDGSYQKIENIHISPLDLGVQRGHSIFDFLKIKNRVNPFMDLYLDRLYQSANAVMLSIAENRNQWPSIVATLLDKNKTDDAFFKIIVSAGPSNDGHQPIGPSKTLVIDYPSISPPKHIYESGGKLTLRSYHRDLPAIKSTNYLYPSSIADDMREHGIIDVLYHHEGKITECSRSNFFLILPDRIVTPAVEILNGITRQRVLNTKNLSLNVLQTEVSLDDITTATEAFITSTTKGVMPITQIDDRVIGDGLVGNVTKELMNIINTF